MAFSAGRDPDPTFGSAATSPSSFDRRGSSGLVAEPSLLRIRKFPSRADPVGGDFVSTWKTLDEFKAEGRARSIGVSNFEIAHLERLAAETGTMPTVNGVDLYPYSPNEVDAYGRASRRLDGSLGANRAGQSLQRPGA
jgi:hypothetical protein